MHHNKQDTSLYQEDDRQQEEETQTIITNKWKEGSFGEQKNRQCQKERKRDRKQIVWNTTPRINYTQLCVFS